MWKQVAGIVLLVVLAAAGWLAWQVSSSPKVELPINTRMGGPFTLVNQHGETVDQSVLQGKVSLLFFGFTYCPDICPATLAQVSYLLNRLKPREAAEVQGVFVSFDPKRDTPEHLKTYLQFFHDSFIGLTGSAEQVNQAAQQFGVVYLLDEHGTVSDSQSAPEHEDYLFSHSDFVYLVDQQGRVRKLYKSDFDTEELIRDLRSLL